MRIIRQTDAPLRLFSPAPWRLLATLALCAFAVTAWAQSPRVVLTPASGFTIIWDGNNGGFSSPDAGAGPSNNIALASNGTMPFTSSDLGPALGLPFHRAVNLNDGLYGNSHSWISANGLGAPPILPFAGLALPLASTSPALPGVATMATL